jgi:hypothetical protein
MHIGVQHVALQQVFVVFGISTPRAMIDEFRALADLASYGEIPTFVLSSRIFDVPAVLTTVETKSFSGAIWPQIQAVFPGQEPIERSTMNAWDDTNFVGAIQKSGKKKIIVSGQL